MLQFSNNVLRSKKSELVAKNKYQTSSPIVKYRKQGMLAKRARCLRKQLFKTIGGRKATNKSLELRQNLLKVQSEKTQIQLRMLELEKAIETRKTTKRLSVCPEKATDMEKAIVQSMIIQRRLRRRSLHTC